MKSRKLLGAGAGGYPVLLCMHATAQTLQNYNRSSVLLDDDSVTLETSSMVH